jgi:itaconate CoA-transferase
LVKKRKIALVKKKSDLLPLAGVRVTSLEHAVGAPFSSRLLGDLGAEIVKIERPGRGDFGRHWDTSIYGLSSYFVWLNRNKKSVVLNLKNEEGKRILDKMLKRSDVFIQNLGPGGIQKLGFAPELICKKYPRLIYCSISGYGQGGPYRDEKAYDLLIQGESGLISLTGYEDKPAKVGISIADISSGLYATIAILSALIRRSSTGKGGFIDISMFDCMVDLVAGSALYFRYSGTSPKREGMRHNLIVPYGPFLASDGKYVSIAVENEEEWKTFCSQVIQRPGLIEDKRFSSNEQRLKNRDQLEPEIESIFQTKTSDQWFDLLRKADIACGHVNDISDVLKHPQLEYRRLLQRLRTEKGLISAISNPMKMRGVKLPMEEVPSLGQHTLKVLKSLGYTQSQIKKLEQHKVI